MPDEVQSLMMEAEAAHAQKDWDEAIRKYQAVMEIDPANEEACSKLAELYAIRGMISNVIDQYFVLMDILEQKHEYELAVEVARWIMKLQPDNDKARMKTILIYKRNGDMEEVVKQSLQLARLYIESEQGEQAILLLKNAQELAPDNLDIGLELAEMYIGQGHIPEGTAQYKKIANAYLEKGNYEKAAESFRRMKVVQPDDPQLLFTLGNLYMSLGKLNEAEAEFRAILRHNLNHTDALMALGNVCQKKGQFRDAILAFNKILSVNPQDEIAKEKLGELYQAQGATGEAVKFYLQAANSYQYGNAVDRAIKLYQRVLSIDPTNPTACRELTNLGASLVPEDSEEETLKDAYSPVIAPLEVDEAELDMIAGPSLEEMAGAILPPSSVTIPEAAKEERKIRGKTAGEREKKEGTPKAEVPVGAVPSRFGTTPDIEITPVISDVGSDIEYSGKEEEQEFYAEEEEEEEETAISRRARKPKRKDLKKKDKFEKKSQKGLVKKGLFKQEEEKKPGKSGLLSSRGKVAAVKKEMVTKKAAPSKGLFSRRGTKEKVEEYPEEALEAKKVAEEREEAFKPEVLEPEYEPIPEEREIPEQAHEEEEISAETYPPSEEQEFMEEMPASEEFDEEKYGTMEVEQEEYGQEPEAIEPVEAEYPSFEEEEGSFPVEESYAYPEIEEAELPSEIKEEATAPPAAAASTVATKDEGPVSLLGKRKKPLKEVLGKRAGMVAPVVTPTPAVKAAEVPTQAVAKQEIVSKPEIQEIPEPLMLETPEAPEIPEIPELPEFPEFPEEEDYEEKYEYEIEPLPQPLPQEEEEEEYQLAYIPEVEEPLHPIEVSTPAKEKKEPEPYVEAELPTLDEEMEYPEEVFPEEITEEGELPELDLGESDSEEMGEEPLPPVQEELSPIPMDSGSVAPLETPPPVAPEVEKEESDFTLDFGLKETSSDMDFFDISSLPPIDAAPTKRLDFDDFTASLLKLADEIEQIIPDEERIREAEEKKKMEEELLAAAPAEEKAPSSSQGKLLTPNAPIPISEIVAKAPKPAPRAALPTAFLELPSVLDLGEEEMSLESLPKLPEEKSEKEVTPEVPIVAPETVILPPLEEIIEAPTPTQILEEIEAPPEIEIEEEEVVGEIIEEAPPPEPEVDIEEQVRELIAQGDLGRAFPLFKEAVEKKSENFALLREYADLSYDYGMVDEAIRAYKILLEKDKTNYEIRKKIIRAQLLSNYNDDAVVSLLEYGNELTSEDKVEEALRIFQYVLALQKENPQAREALSDIYLNLDMKELALHHLNILANYLEEKKDIEKAINVLKKIYALTSSVQTHEKLANIYIQNNFIREGIAELMSLADYYIQKNDLLKAAGNFEKIVQLDPEHLDAHQKLASIYDKVGNKEKSYKEKVIIADLFLNRGNLDEAQKRYEECLSLRNTDQEVRRKLVNIYLKRKNLSKALEEARILSEVYHKERRYDEAIVLYQQLIDSDPHNVLLRDKLSEFYVMTNQLDKGLQQLIIVAEELMEKKDWDGAIKAYKKALTIDSKNADLHFRIGEIFLHQKKNTTEARFEFAKVFELDPTHRKAMEYLVNLYLEEDKPAQAINVLKSLIDIDSSYYALQNKIIDDYQEKINVNPEDNRARFNLGIIYKELKMWTKAIEQFQHTRKSDKYVLESHAMLGACFSQQPAMLNLAIKTLEKGLQLPGYVPKDYIDLHYQLGTLYMNMKKYDKALAEFQAVAAIDIHYKDTADLLKEVKKKIK